eukprot:scaffold110629_cov25-Prasinocladus_malaysianus.AAC.1
MITYVPFGAKRNQLPHQPCKTTYLERFGKPEHPGNTENPDGVDAESSSNIDTHKGAQGIKEMMKRNGMTWNPYKEEYL